MQLDSTHSTNSIPEIENRLMICLFLDLDLMDLFEIPKELDDDQSSLIDAIQTTLTPRSTTTARSYSFVSVCRESKRTR
jgi:hypothetical protein